MRVDSANKGSSCTDRRSFPEQISKKEYKEALSTIQSLAQQRTLSVRDDNELKDAWRIKKLYIALKNKYNEKQQKR